MNKEKYSYYTKFKIESEESLDDFWSFAVFRLNINDNKLVCERFTKLYNIILGHKFQDKQKIVILLYETATHFLLKIKTNVIKVENAIKKRLEEDKFLYTIDNGVVVYDIKKLSPAAKPIVTKNKERTVEKITEKVEKKITVFTFVAEDDLDDLSNIIEKIQVKNYSKTSPVFGIDELNDYRSSFSYFATICSSYDELKTVSELIAELAVVLSLNANQCLIHGVEMRASLSGFINDIETWMTKLFYDGCDAIDFMDASFGADLAQFKILLGLNEESEDDVTSLDDIFDF